MVLYANPYLRPYEHSLHGLEGFVLVCQLRISGVRFMYTLATPTSGAAALPPPVLTPRDLFNLPLHDGPFLVDCRAKVQYEKSHRCHVLDAMQTLNTVE